MMDIYTEIDLKQRIKDAIEERIELDTFINEIGWEDWMQAYTDKDENNGEELTTEQIKAINNDIKEIYDETKAEMPLRLFKVYPNCVRCIRHITMIPKYDEHSTISEAAESIIEDCINCGTVIIDDELSDEEYNEEYNLALSKVFDYIDEYGMVETGDYMLIRAYGEGCFTIPNKCDYTVINY